MTLTLMLALVLRAWQGALFAQRHGPYPAPSLLWLVPWQIQLQARVSFSRQQMQPAQPRMFWRSSLSHRTCTEQCLYCLMQVRVPD